MMFFFAALIGIMGSELFFRLPLMKTVSSMSLTLQKAISVIRSPKISDCWKERVILRYSFTVFAGTFRLICYFGVVVAMVGLIVLIGLYFDKNFLDFLMSVKGLAFITAISLGYIFVRKRVPKSQYSVSAKILHYVALSNRSIAEASFDIEQATQKPRRSSIINQKHVFVAGLPRAGTTVLMRRFYSSGMFGSLNYRDMPFVLMPNLWNKLSASSRKHSARKERAHGRRPPR